MNTPPYLHQWESLVETLRRNYLNNSAVEDFTAMMTCSQDEEMFFDKDEVEIQYKLSRVTEPAKLWEEVLTHALMGEVVIWRGDLIDSATRVLQPATANATEISLKTIEDEWPQRCQFWMLEDGEKSKWWDGLSALMSESFVVPMTCTAIAIRALNDIEETVAFLLVGKPLHSSGAVKRMPYVMGWYDNGHIVPHTAIAIMFAEQFCRQSYVSRERQNIPNWKPSRATRLVKTPDVSRIVLRKIAPDFHGSADSYPAHRDYSCQWLVGGHWRKLPQPRKSDGAERTYVRPHVKGPDGKPLVSRVKVAHVKR